MNLKEWCIVLILPLFCIFGMAQCTYDNYVKWKVAQAAIHIKNQN
ncbi:MAG: hypothetical protein RSC68_35230 [Acinetobacter sp.]